MITATVTLDELTNSQYWTGHGHSHEPDNLLACIVVVVTPELSDTADEFVEKFMSSFQIQDWDIMNYDLSTEKRLDDEDAIIELLVENELRLAIGEAPNERMYHQDEPFGDDVYFYCWVHVYEVDEE